jgi:methanogenic corrinoid protein MtbC1
MENEALETRQRHPIRVVAERTGLSLDVLRAWEKRYGVVEPERSGTGRRLYSDVDVDRLLLLRRATEAGRPIGRIASLSDGELRALVEEDDEARGRRERALSGPVAAESMAFVEAALEQIRALDAAALDAVLVHAAFRQGTAVFLEDVAAVLLRRIGELWHAGTIRSAHEHMASAVIRRVLSWLMWSGHSGPEASVIVVATPVGQVHELGALLSAAAAAGEGWRVVYLGADLPADEIARVARETNADALGLSVVFATEGSPFASELRRLGAELPERVSVFVGGSAAGRYAAVIREVGGHQMTDLAEFRARLSDLAGKTVRRTGTS